MAQKPSFSEEPKPMASLCFESQRRLVLTLTYQIEPLCGRPSPQAKSLSEAMDLTHLPNLPVYSPAVRLTGPCGLPSPLCLSNHPMIISSLAM